MGQIENSENSINYNGNIFLCVGSGKKKAVGQNSQKDISVIKM